VPEDSVRGPAEPVSPSAPGSCAPSGDLDEAGAGTTTASFPFLTAAEITLEGTVALSTAERITLACIGFQAGAEAERSKIVAVPVTNLQS